MLSTFRATIRMLLRTPSALVWGLAFPIILATMFVFMFSGFRTAESINAVPVAVVADDAWNTSTFSQVMDALAEGEEPLLSCIEVADEGSALELLSTGEVDGGSWLMGLLLPATQPLLSMDRIPSSHCRGSSLLPRILLRMAVQTAATR